MQIITKKKKLEMIQQKEQLGIMQKYQMKPLSRPASQDQIKIRDMYQQIILIIHTNLHQNYCQCFLNFKTQITAIVISKITSENIIDILICVACCFFGILFVFARLCYALW